MKFTIALLSCLSLYPLFGQDSIYLVDKYLPETHYEVEHTEIHRDSLKIFEFDGTTLLHTEGKEQTSGHTEIIDIGEDLGDQTPFAVSMENEYLPDHLQGIAQTYDGITFYGKNFGGIIDLDSVTNSNSSSSKDFRLLRTFKENFDNFAYIDVTIPLKDSLVLHSSKTYDYISPGLVMDLKYVYKYRETKDDIVYVDYIGLGALEDLHFEDYQGVKISLVGEMRFNLLNHNLEYVHENSEEIVYLGTDDSKAQFCSYDITTRISHMK